MTTDIESFMLAEPRPSAKFALVDEDLFALRAAGATYGQIVKFLKGKNIDAERGEIYRYLNRKIRKRRLTAVNAGPQGTKDNDSSGSHGTATKAAPLPAPAAEKPGATGTDLPQFNWSAVRKDCKLNW